MKLGTEQFAQMTAAQAAAFMTETTQREHPVRERLARIVGEFSVLDIGCGKGDLVKDLFVRAQYLGVDCSPELIALARQANPGYDFVVADGARLPWKDRWRFGIIKSVLEHVPEAEALAIYAEARRCCETLLVAWHTEPLGPMPIVTTYEGELGKMLQIRHRRPLFEGIVEREVCPPHVIWTVQGLADK